MAKKKIDNEAMSAKLEEEIKDMHRFIEGHKKNIKLKTAEKEVYDLRIEVAHLKAMASLVEGDDKKSNDKN